MVSVTDGSTVSDGEGVTASVSDGEGVTVAVSDGEGVTVSVSDGEGVMVSLSVGTSVVAEGLGVSVTVGGWLRLKESIKVLEME